MPDSGLELFHPLISRWFREQVGTPTDIQTKAWPAIAEGRHVLITAPTGCGKTLAAFLWAMHQLIIGAWKTKGAPAVLYVSPLKSLNNDVQRNVMRPLAELKVLFEQEGQAFPGISVLTRSGDTPGEERRRMLRQPPQILITTPESLNLLLTSRGGSALLTGLSTVILDEIHAVAGTKRGTHLITAVERLVLLSGEFQRVALSATVRPAEGVAEFVGGFVRTSSDSYPAPCHPPAPAGGGERFLATGENEQSRVSSSARHLALRAPFTSGAGGRSRCSWEPPAPAGGGSTEPRQVAIVRSHEQKAYELNIAYPSEADTGEPPGGSRWPVLVRELRDIIGRHRSTLVFVNSRRTAERLTRLINESAGKELAYAHHGSLAREIRLAVEQKLKNGELRAIVATSSLELGIDIGDLDRVVLVQTPREVSSTVQRIGRAGHGVNEKSRGTIFPMHGRDCVIAAVTARAVLDQDIEEIRPVEAPLDLLAQIILSMTSRERWNLDDLYSFLRTSYPYRALSRRSFDMVLDMLAGRYAETRVRELRARVTVDRMDNTVEARTGVAYLLYTSGGTIPERGYFDLRLRDTRAKIGELDEEFVWERRVGETFSLGAQLWKIENITHNDVEVVPARSAQGIVPFWRAEEQNRHFHLSERIGLFLERADSRLGSPGFLDELKDQHAMEDGAARELVKFLKLQKEATGSSLPHRHHLLVEHVEQPGDRGDLAPVILHTGWGGRVNTPLALALAQAWEERERRPLQIIEDDEGLLLLTPPGLRPAELFSLVTPENVEACLRRNLEQSGFFGARFRENAERALLLPKPSFKRRMPLWLIRLRSKELFGAVRSRDDFPVLLETWRSCLQDEFDLDHLRQVLEEIREKTIAVTETATRSPSPFSGRLIWKQTNISMYDDDTLPQAGETALRPDLIRDVLFSAQLRPKVPADVIRLLDQKLKRTAAGYAPDSGRDLLDWIRDRVLVPEPEWKELAAAIRRDHDLDGQDLLGAGGEKTAWISWPGVSHPFLAVLDSIPRVLVAFRLLFEDLTLRPGAGGGSAASMRRSVEAVAEREATRSAEYDLPVFLSEWLSFYGPVPKQTLVRLLGVTRERLDEALVPLVEARSVVADVITEDQDEIEICDAQNLDVLLRMTRRYRRPSFQPIPCQRLPLFLALVHGISDRGLGRDVLQQRLEQLFGWPAPARAWEEELLPARIAGYRSEWLDSLMQESDLIWFGCGDRRVSLAFRQDLELFREGGDHPGSDAELDRLIPDHRGKYSFLEITEFSRLDTSRTSDLLWKEAWKGSVTSDSFRAIRKGVAAGFRAQNAAGEIGTLSRRAGFSRWKQSRPIEGHWMRIDGPARQRDVLEEEELIRDRARQLLKRHGLLFRELVINESQPLQWRAVFRSLRLMELSGEIVSGYFFEGIPGPQFMSHEAFRMLNGPLPDSEIFWINATDPASLCGIPVDTGEALPARVPSTHLVYQGSLLALVSKRFGRSLEIRVKPDHGALQAFFGLFGHLLTRDFNPLPRIVVESINGEAAGRSPFAAALKQFGFRQVQQRMELWKEY